MKFTRHITLLLWLLTTPTLVISQTYGTDIDNLYLMDFTPGACSATLIGAFTSSGTGVSVSMFDIALCSDGILYGMGGTGLYEINTINAVSTLLIPIFSPNNALACSPDFRLFGVGGGNVLEFFVGPMTSSAVGSTGYVSAGDLVYYKGLWYHTVLGGLLEIPNIDAPGTNQLIYPGGPHQGVTVSPNTCNSLILPESQYSEIDLATGILTPICNIGQIGQSGLTSMFEFQTPPPCPMILDLDDDDSSGASDADYNGDMYTCATEDGLNIADEDVYISSFNDIVDITINIDMGLLDPPDEILILTAANNITITGSGTDQIILSNNGGATVEDFEMAISNIKYYNQKTYPTPGIREIKVVIEDTDGEFSNDAIGYITMTQYEDLIVDLGPDITACEDELIFIDAGLGDTYNWSTSETTQLIFPNLAGEYAVTVTQFPKCPGIDTIEIYHLPAVNFQIDIEGPICVGEDFIIYVLTDYEGIFDIELLNVNTNELYYFENTMNGDTLTISNIDNTFLQINQIVLLIEDICAIDGSGLIDIVVNDVITESLEASICQYDSILYRGVYLKEEGEYLDTVVTALTCDSLIIFNLDVFPLYVDTIFQFSCDTADVGFYKDSLTTIMGCDSIINLDISLSPNHDTTIVSTSCDFEQVIDTIIQLTNQYGCDSTVHSIVNYALSDTTEVTTFTCNPTEVDTVIQELVSMDGCDSIAISFVVLVSPDTTYLDLITCDSTAVGLTINMEMNMSGCDSLIYENYIYQEPSTENLQIVVCDPTNQGLQIDTLISSFGCDSIFVTTENVYFAPDTIQISQSSCDPLIVGVSYNSLINIYGCDSIIEETTISYQPLDTVYLQQSTCNSSLAVTNVDLYTTAENCDSIVQIEVIFTPLDTTYIFDTSCNIGSIGIEYISLNTIEGCDSIVKSEVSFTPLDTTYVFDTSCQLDSVGINYVLLNTAEGCDSIIAKSISFDPQDTTFSTLETCDIILNNTIDTLTFQIGDCDSVVIETSFYVGSDTTFLFETTCIDSEAGLSTINLSNIFGCDSTIVLDIALMPSHNMFFTDTICYITNDSIEEFMLINQFGCDSLITIKKIYEAPYLDLGLDQSILSGEEVLIEVNTSITDGDLFWSSDPFLDLVEFDDLTIMPKENITITLQILSTEGCEANDQIMINVESENTLIFPNVFSPNSDGFNDIFTFNLDDFDIESIESLYIFDRWGNKVHSINNVNSSTPFGWNGEIDGQKVESGVYVFFAQLRMLSGENVTIVQDLVVLR